jgi:methylated-DNA-[protein]-cysteine S-methyltransferase
MERTMTELLIDHIQTPVGVLYLVVQGESICGLGFPDAEGKARATLERQVGDVRWREVDDPAGVSSQLRSYFAGALGVLDGLPVVSYGTPFQQRVWAALRRIPVGATVSYQQIAKAIGSPAACRAVGLANGRNPVSIVVPCHRVIGANSSLTGYGGGLERKEWLLRHEMANMSLLSHFPEM